MPPMSIFGPNDGILKKPVESVGMLRIHPGIHAIERCNSIVKAFKTADRLEFLMYVAGPCGIFCDLLDIS